MTKFYDAHCHMMNLSHPNLSAFLKRLFKELNVIKRMEISLGTFLFAIPFVGPYLPSLFKADNRAMNMLAVMETELGDCILQLEEDLRKNLNWGNGPIVSGSDEKIQYNKIVLTPLMMDFGLKRNKEEKFDTFYKIRWKPIASQVLDLFLGIKYYYEHRGENPLPGGNPKTPLFEIYPFMGINTKNYKLPEEDSGGSLNLKELLNKYFDRFADDTTITRRENLEAHNCNWINFTGDIEKTGPYSYIGIKVYPPLGFNPWPTETQEANEEDNGDIQMNRVQFLYSFCEHNNIPITSHCSEGGFLVDKKYKQFSDPDKWTKVLDKYPNLRLNLAHFGAKNKKWRKAIAKLILEHKNVYTDISYRGVDKGYYKVLKKFLDDCSTKDKEKLMKRIIFGSDFMINLMSIDTYGTYMKYFSETTSFTAEEKDLFCSKNPERFLFLG